ncbi:MAG: hypothetical protein NVSMB52_09980 [Chloroflexota bacterium]
MEVDLEKEPSEGETLVFTTAGGFLVKGSQLEVAHRLIQEEWSHFELSGSGDLVILRGQHVVALRGGTKSKRGVIGFVHRD